MDESWAGPCQHSTNVNLIYSILQKIVNLPFPTLVVLVQLSLKVYYLKKFGSKSCPINVLSMLSFNTSIYHTKQCFFGSLNFFKLLYHLISCCSLNFGSSQLFLLKDCILAQKNLQNIDDFFQFNNLFKKNPDI